MVYGARIKVKDGQQVTAGETIVEWDPYTISILTEVSGKATLADIVEGFTMKEEVDEVTGLARKVIVEHHDEGRQPNVSIRDSENKVIGRYILPAGAHLAVNDGDHVAAGDVIAKILVKRPRPKTSRVVCRELPSCSRRANLRTGGHFRDRWRGEIWGLPEGCSQGAVVADDGEEREYLIPRGKHVYVHEGDRVRAGEPLMDGAVNPHDILDVQDLKRCNATL